MADNYIEKKWEDYERRKQLWQQKKRRNLIKGVPKRDNQT